MSLQLHIVDGSLLEGGGQILRNSAALSAITGTPIRVENIRAGRSKPGLRPQHMTGLKLIETVSRGTLQGAHVGSCTISLYPGQLTAGHYEADTQTAGSCTLMVQQALPCLLFAPCNGSEPSISRLTLRGGTDADLAPPVDYLVHVLAPTLRRLFDLDTLKVECLRRGFMPQGSGCVEVSCSSLEVGTALNSFNLTKRGEVTQVRVSAFTAGKVPAPVGSEMVEAAAALLAKRLGLGVAITKHAMRETKETAFGDGAGLCVVAETSTGCLLGATVPYKQRKPVHALAAAVVEELMEVLESGSCVDQWMQDQLIVFMGLASGESSMLCTEPSLHTRTAIAIVQALLPDARFQVTTVQGRGSQQQLWMIRCHGAGFKMSS